MSNNNNNIPSVENRLVF